MVHYYLNKKEISEAQAKEIEAKNKEYLASGDFNLWEKIQFIVKVNK